jgi:tetratricopeptide (TPR) repeat protein
MQQLEPLMLQQGDEAGSAAVKRGQEAQIAYFQGWWAARQGNYAAAQKQADRINQLFAPDANPLKLQPMHQIEGFIALYQGKYKEAAAHLRMGNLTDPYVKYQLAVATEGAGDPAQAKQMYREIADYNFNVLGFALVRKRRATESRDDRNLVIGHRSSVISVVVAKPPRREKLTRGFAFRKLEFTLKSRD